MAASAEIAAYRRSGASVAATAAHFGVSERRVYQALQAVPPGRAASSPAPTSLPSSLPSSLPTLPALSIIPEMDAIADGATEWRDPIAGRREIPPAGMCATDWFNRKPLQTPEQLVPAADFVDTSTTAQSVSLHMQETSPELHMQTGSPSRIAYAEYALQQRLHSPSLVRHNKKLRLPRLSLSVSAVNDFGPSFVERVPPWLWPLLALIVCLFIFQ